jgi:hypothetical protein
MQRRLGTSARIRWRHSEDQVGVPCTKQERLALAFVDVVHAPSASSTTRPAIAIHPDRRAPAATQSWSEAADHRPG